MSDPPPEPVNDNTNPDVDNLASVTTESRGQTIVCESELEDDFFVCRKCNKVFKDLSEYLEHKIRDENYKLSHTRSKVLKRMVIPSLVEKKKNVSKVSRVKDSGNSGKTTQPDGRTEEPDDRTEDVNDDSRGNSSNVAKSKKGRKKKVETKIHEAMPSLVKENSCHLCDQKFRRAASLRWHLKCDHKGKEDNSDDSDTPAEVLVKMEMDEEFVPTVNKDNEEGNDHVLSEDERKDGFRGKRKITVLSTVRSKKEDNNKGDLLKGEETSGDERPFVCDICGRGFKELPVYKAHATVHSNERNYVCTEDGCPYGFKTKGCLVRHMRRHTGERPFECEKCGRAFSESGALNRHLKARRNCAHTPDSHYPRYKKKWSYHPNIEAVVDQNQRDVHIATEQDSLDTKFFIHDDPLQLPELVRDRVIVTGGSTEDSVGDKAVQVKSEIIETEKWPGNGEGTDDASADGHLSISVEMSENINTEEREKHLGIKSSTTYNYFSEKQCQVCFKECPNVEMLEIHLRTHLADEPRHCGLCHFLAQNREEMRQHILAMHNESLNDIESALFSMERNNQLKSVSVMQQKDDRISLREALQAVKQLHRLKSITNEKGVKPDAVTPSTTGSLQCLICNRTFKGLNYMRQHMRMHTGDRPFKCSQCNHSFTSKDVLKKHMYVHMNMRNYKCGECGKMFKRLVHVQQHIKTHSQDRSFRCSVCEKYFKTHNSLKVHLRTHTNINPYRCQVCNRHFRERGSLQRHMRLHTGEKPYVCQYCNRGFAEQGTLSRHLKAKVPCSSIREGIIQPGHQNNNTMLAQFSSVVAETQYILPPVSNEELVGGNLIVLNTDHEESEEVIENVEILPEERTVEVEEEDKGQAETLTVVESVDQGATQMSLPVESVDQIINDGTESLQVYDPTTGESLIITGDKAVIDIVRSQQLAIESMHGGLSLEKIQEILTAAGEGPLETTTEDGLVMEQVDDEANTTIVTSNSNGEMVISQNPDTDIKSVMDGSSSIIISQGSAGDIVLEAGATTSSSETEQAPTILS